MSACHFEEVSGGVASRWVVELSVVKHVERVDSDLDLTLARDSDALFQADVRIVPSGADNEVAHRIPICPTGSALYTPFAQVFETFGQLIQNPPLVRGFKCLRFPPLKFGTSTPNVPRNELSVE